MGALSMRGAIGVCRPLPSHVSCAMLWCCMMLPLYAFEHYFRLPKAQCM